MKRLNSTLGLVAAFVVGCASTSVPPARVASTEEAVKTARDAGAERDDNARQHLAQAESELGEAKKIIAAKGDAEQAEALLTRAKSDAALAASLSRESQMRAKAAAPE
jgi:7-keto-8-aminopelargonate synthetase-like enzyme